MMRMLVGAAGFAAAMLAATPVNAQEMRYVCSAGELDYEIIRAVGNGTIIDPQFVIVAMTMGEMKDPLDGAFVLPMTRRGMYEGPDGSLSLYDLAFTPSGGTPVPCTGANATQTAGTGSAAQPGPSEAGYGSGSIADPGDREPFAVERPGISLGGKVRGGPGTEHAHVTSLPEGTPVTITLNSGTWWNGYDWFVIEANGRQIGYQWGGILCAPTGDVPGTFPCP